MQAIRAALKTGRQSPGEIADHGVVDCGFSPKTLQRMAVRGGIGKGGRGRTSQSYAPRWVTSSTAIAEREAAVQTVAELVGKW
jgi:hypothetical protein